MELLDAALDPRVSHTSPLFLLYKYRYTLTIYIYVDSILHNNDWPQMRLFISASAKESRNVFWGDVFTISCRSVLDSPERFSLSTWRRVCFFDDLFLTYDDRLIDESLGFLDCELARNIIVFFFCTNRKTGI